MASFEPLYFTDHVADTGAIFPKNLFKENEFGGETGIVKGKKFSVSEIQEIKDLISEHLANIIKAQSPFIASEFINRGLQNYHLSIDDLIHSKCLAKSARTLPENSCKKIQQMSFFNYLNELIGNFHLADEEGVGHQQITFRITRPNKKEDVGSMHRDSWFWEQHGFKVAQDHGRFKCWTQIEGEPRKSGLILMPGSHREQLDYTVQKNNNKLSFAIGSKYDETRLRQYCESLGSPVMFNHDVLHGGSVNHGQYCRVSFELTIVFKERGSV